MAGIFNRVIFNNAVFNTGQPAQPALANINLAALEADMIALGG